MFAIARHMALRATTYLERLGIDCSRDANEGDFIAIAVGFGLTGGLLFAWVSPWWSGFITAATIFCSYCWIKAYATRTVEIATSKKLKAAEHLCQVYFEIALSAGLTEDEIRRQREKLYQNSA